VFVLVGQDVEMDGPATHRVLKAQGRSGQAALVTSSAALLAGAVLLALSHSGTAAAAALLLLAALLVLALRSGSGAAVDAVILTILLYAAVAAGVFGLWPLPGAVAVLVAWWLARRSPRGQLWRSWM